MAAHELAVLPVAVVWCYGLQRRRKLQWWARWGLALFCRGRGRGRGSHNAKWSGGSALTARNAEQLEVRGSADGWAQAASGREREGARQRPPSRAGPAQEGKMGGRAAAGKEKGQSGRK